MALEVTKDQLTALMRGEAVTIGPSKRVVTLDDGPFTVKHFGPGPHPGTGTPQEIHGGGAGVRPAVNASEGYNKTRELRKQWNAIAEAINSEYWHNEFIHSSYQVFERIPGTARWKPVRDALDAIDSVHGVYVNFPLPMTETRARSKGGSYHTANNEPSRFMLKIEDEYGFGTETSTVHEIGHYIDHWLLAQEEPYGVMWNFDVVSKFYDPESPGPDWEAKAIEASAYDDRTYDRFGHYGDETFMGNLFRLYDAVRNSPHVERLTAHLPGMRKKLKVPEDYFYGDRNRPEATAASLANSEITVSQPASMKAGMLKPRELFARAYTQYIAFRSQNPKMMLQINESLNWEKVGGLPVYSNWDEFTPIAEAFDDLFRSKGWLKP